MYARAHRTWELVEARGDRRRRRVAGRACLDYAVATLLRRSGRRFPVAGDHGKPKRSAGGRHDRPSDHDASLVAYYGKGNPYAEPHPVTALAHAGHGPGGPGHCCSRHAGGPAGGGGSAQEDRQHRGQGARHARPALEHARTVAGHLALHVPRADAVRDQGRQGDDGRSGARPGRELDAVTRGDHLDVQAPEGRSVPQGLRRADGRGREVQLRATDQEGAGHALRREPRRHQVDRGRQPLHGPDRADGLRSDLPPAHGGLPAGLHHLQEGGGEAGGPVQVESRRHRPLLFRAAHPAREDHSQSLRQVLRRPAANRRSPLVRRARGRHQADRPREGDVRPALPRGGHRRLCRSGEEDGRGHRPARPGPAGALLHQHDQAALRRHSRPQGVHARDRPQGHQGDHVSRRSGEGGVELRAARLLRPRADAVPRAQRRAGQEAAGRSGLSERHHDQKLLHQQVLLLPEGAHAGPGAAQAGRHQRRAPGRRARDVSREHPEEPESVRALRRHAHHRRRPVALAVLRRQGDSRSGHRQQGHELRPLQGHRRPAPRRPGRARREEARGDLRRGPEADGARPGVPAHQRRAGAVGAQPQAREHAVRR